MFRIDRKRTNHPAICLWETGVARFLAPAPKGTRARDREPSCQRMHWLLPGEPAITRPHSGRTPGWSPPIYQAAGFAWLKRSRTTILGNILVGRYWELALPARRPR